LGKPLKIMTHPLRADIPIYLGAEGPKNVAQTAAIADGWLPLYYSPFRPEVYADQLAAAPAGFDIVAMTTFSITDDVAAGLMPVRAMLGFYIGGMGAKGTNYHANLMSRMGYAEEAAKVQELFFAGRREDAIAAYCRWLPLINHENRQCGLAASKALMQEGGVIAFDTVRHPIPPLHPAARAGLLEIARRLDPMVLRWGR
jgi:hypothetical protein